MNYLIERARCFATGAHSAIKQTRKYTGVPYILHPKAVAELVKSANGTEEQIAAAWLHDVVEDTGVPIEDIRQEFGEAVGNYVNWLTDASKPEDGNRVQRKKKDRLRIAKAPPEVKTIKLADLIDNTSTIAEFDKDFAKIYMAEKKELLFALKDGDHSLLIRAMQQIENYEAALSGDNG